MAGDTVCVTQKLAVRNGTVVSRHVEARETDCQYTYQQSTSVRKKDYSALLPFAIVSSKGLDSRDGLVIKQQKANADAVQGEVKARCPKHRTGLIL